MSRISDAMTLIDWLILSVFWGGLLIAVAIAAAASELSRSEWQAENPLKALRRRRKRRKLRL